MIVPESDLETPGFLGARMQVAFVVTDLDLALKYWTETMGIGPFIVIENSVAGRRVIHRGRPTELDTTLAFSYVGEVQIEIVHQTNDAPSPFKEFTDSGREGLQHIAYWPKDFDNACTYLESRGFSEICSMYLKDGTRNVAYFSPPDFIGTMVEIVPMTAARRTYFGRIKRLAAAWDGKRPVRRYPSREAFLATGEGTR